MWIENALYKFIITITILDIEIFIPKNEKNQKER